MFPSSSIYIQLKSSQQNGEEEKEKGATVHNFNIFRYVFPSFKQRLQTSKIKIKSVKIQEKLSRNMLKLCVNIN